jgi:methyl-accepting chemotaxis protein
MRQKNRRKHFLVDKSLQFHYLFYITLILFIVSGVSLVGSYYGIWASVIEAFSAESLHQSLMTAAQIQDYEEARRPHLGLASLPSFRNFRETSLLSEYQKEMIQQIMSETNRRIASFGLLLLAFIGWGSIFLTHKVAGPIFKLGKIFGQIAEGDLTVRMKLRKFDEAKRLIDPFNKMLATLDGSIAKIKRLIHATPHLPEELKRELAKFKTTVE